MTGKVPATATRMIDSWAIIGVQSRTFRSLPGVDFEKVAEFIIRSAISQHWLRIYCDLFYRLYYSASFN